MLAGTATESNISTDLSGYARNCQRTGEMASKANIKYRVKDLARKELFKHVKTYRGAVSEERKRKNKIWEDFVRKFFVSSLPKVSITDELWRVIQKHTTEALRSKRSSVTEAMKRIVTGKDNEALYAELLLVCWGTARKISQILTASHTEKTNCGCNTRDAPPPGSYKQGEQSNRRGIEETA